jgi:inorganic pyrophosphatase
MTVTPGRRLIGDACDGPPLGTMDAMELPAHRLAILRRFFQDYKTLEGKAVEVDQFHSKAAALPIIEQALERSSQQRRRGFP